MMKANCVAIQPQIAFVKLYNEQRATKTITRTYRVKFDLKIEAKKTLTNFLSYWIWVAIHININHRNLIFFGTLIQWHHWIGIILLHNGWCICLVVYLFAGNLALIFAYCELIFKWLYHFQGFQTARSSEQTPDSSNQTKQIVLFV